MKDRTIKLK